MQKQRISITIVDSKLGSCSIKVHPLMKVSQLQEFIEAASIITGKSRRHKRQALKYKLSALYRNPLIDYFIIGDCSVEQLSRLETICRSISPQDSSNCSSNDQQLQLILKLPQQLNYICGNQSGLHNQCPQIFQSIAYNESQNSIFTVKDIKKKSINSYNTLQKIVLIKRALLLMKNHSIKCFGEFIKVQQRQGQFRFIFKYIPKINILLLTNFTFSFDKIIALSIQVIKLVKILLKYGIIHNITQESLQELLNKIQYNIKGHLVISDLLLAQSFQQKSFQKLDVSLIFSFCFKLFSSKMISQPKFTQSFHVKPDKKSKQETLMPLQVFNEIYIQNYVFKSSEFKNEDKAFKSLTNILQYDSNPQILLINNASTIKKGKMASPNKYFTEKSTKLMPYKREKRPYFVNINKKGKSLGRQNLSLHK